MNDSSEVKLHFLDYWRVIRLRLGLILLTFFLVMVTAGVYVYFLPKQYFAKLKMEVKPDNSGPVGFFGSGGRNFDPAFISTQFQILQTTEILYPVIDRLNLTKEFSATGQPLTKQQAFGLLKGNIKCTEVRNTGVIEIGVYDLEAPRAALIANTIGVVYQEKRRADLVRMMEAGLGQLKDEVEKQRSEMERKGKIAAEIRIKDEIIDNDPERDVTQGSVADPSMQAAIRQRDEQRARVLQLSEHLKVIEKLEPDHLLSSLRSLNIEDPSVQKSQPLYQDCQAEEARLLNSGVGENHPRLRALRAQKAVYLSILTTALEGIKTTQKQNLAIEQAQLARFEVLANSSQGEQISERSKSANYSSAKSDYLQAKKMYESVQLTLTAEQMKRHVESDTARIWEPAERNDAPARPNRPLYMGVAAIVGIGMGILLAFFVEYLDTSLKTLDDVERFLQAPVLAVIPQNIPVLMNIAGDCPDAEAYRILRANVEFNKPEPDTNVFTLISGGPGEGKSTTLNNLAFTCARGGYNVLVIDADLRRASQHEFFGVENTFGLTDYLLGQAEVEHVIQATKLQNLWFLPSGLLPEDSVGVLNSQRMTDLIARVKHEYDLIFIDSPPILGVSDGAILASEVDAVIMVVQHRRFPRAMLQRVKQAVENVGGRLIGVVLNNVDARHDEGYSYYNSYRDYYATTTRPAPRLQDSTVHISPRPRDSSPEEY